MAKPLVTTPNPDNFDNVDWPVGEYRHSSSHSHPDVELCRVDVPDTRRWRRWLGKLPGVPTHGVREEFQMFTRVAYHDEVRDVTVVVPTSSTFTTDLVSVPGLLTWLVPRSGRHLPAALVHDGLVGGDHGDYETRPELGQRIDRIDADRIFRDAMRDARVGRIRRWLVWSAVSTASLCSGGRDSWGRWHQAYYGVVAFLTFGTIVVLGTAATVDLFDGRLGTLFDVPWMHGDWRFELATGLAGAVVVPFLMAGLWLKHFRVGMVAGVALATLLHATVAVAAVAVVYQVAEWIVQTRVAWVLASVVAVLGSFTMMAIALGTEYG